MNTTNTTERAPASPAVRSVLMVDDEPTICETVRLTVVHAGFSCVTAASVGEACSLLKERSFDLMVLDWHLDRSGLEVIRCCRKLYPAMPIIVVSGLETVDVRTDALLEEVDGFLKKPFSAAVLVNHIGWWIKRQAAQPKLVLPDRKEAIIPLDHFESMYVRHVVTLLNNNISEAAEMLGIHRHTVAKAIRNEVPADVK